MKLPNEEKKLREYILGEISGEDCSQVEERLMTDNNYSQKLAMTEEDLIQDYVDGNLDAAESANFEKRFLHSEENRQKVKFARALRKYVNENAYLPEPEKKPNFFDSLKAFFSSPVPATLAVLIVLGIAGFFLWQTFSSNNSEVLIALNKAYKNDRPTEARITGFEYAPKIEGTRGNNKNENLDLLFAKSRATEAVLKNETAENLRQLGRVFLAENNFDEAIKQFEKAIKLAPDNARLHNDLGAALMEKAKTLDEGKLENLAKANEEFAKAIELDKNLLDAYFNQALAFQALNLPNQAIEAWQKYLELDSTSAWAEEARKNLKSLEDIKAEEISPDQLEKSFIQAVRKGYEAEAFRLLSENRELIRQKYLPQRLAISYTQSNGKEKEILQVLDYIGELEKAKTGDLFAIELANYYKTDADRHFELLEKAHTLVIGGYESCLNGNFSKALIEFQKAKKLFDEAGNVWESQISSHFVAYSNYNVNNLDADTKFWTQNVEFCEKRNFKWLELSNLYWLAGIQDASNKYIESKKNFEKALSLAKECEDSYFLQKIHLALARQSAFFGEKQKALVLLENVLFQTKAQTSTRQKWRNYRDVISILTSLEFYDLASAIAPENISLAERLNDLIFLVESLIVAGNISYKKKDHDEARNFFNEANTKISLIQEPSTRNFHRAQAALEIAQLERETGNYQQSLDFYDEAISLDNKTGFNSFSYAAQKGKLYSYMALGYTDRLDEQIPLVLEIAEKYRREILEEQRRNSFFDAEQSIYDLAAEHEFNQGRYESSYNYSEISNSRSLFDWLQKGVEISNKKNSDVEISLKGTSEPANLADIRSQIPDQIQILQYTVLENKILIWLIAKDKFEVISTEIKSSDLREKVKSYLKLLIEQKTEEKIASHELYDLLIKPIENQLDKGKKICLIPNKILYHLPFAALRSPRQQVFLAEHEILYSPSANVFLLSTRTAETNKNFSVENILSIGNPAFKKEMYQDLPDLPEAESEARQIAIFYNEAKVLIGREATKQAFKALAPQYNIIHFAGHYLVKPGLPLSSGLLLSSVSADTADNELTNAELVSEMLPKTKLVILSACETGFEKYFNGEGMIGLSRTFIASGVPVVIASQWKVDSEATAELMKNFHQFRVRENLSSSTALRRAQLEMLNSPDEKYHSPYFWAGFAIFGGYSNF